MADDPSSCEHFIVDVLLQGVDEEDKSVLENLLQLYRYDLSVVRGYELSEHGTFVYRFLDQYFVEEDRAAFFIRHGGSLAGFAMCRLLNDASRQVAEFFVLRSHQRQGVGTSAALQLFEHFPGRWTVEFDHLNRDGSSFWTKVVEQVAVGTIDTHDEGPPERSFQQRVLNFSTT